MTEESPPLFKKTLKYQLRFSPEQYKFNEVQNVGLLHSDRVSLGIQTTSQ